MSSNTLEAKLLYLGLGDEHYQDDFKEQNTETTEIQHFVILYSASSLTLRRRRASKQLKLLPIMVGDEFNRSSFA